MHLNHEVLQYMSRFLRCRHSLVRMACGTAMLLLLLGSSACAMDAAKPDMRALGMERAPDSTQKMGESAASTPASRTPPGSDEMASGLKPCDVYAAGGMPCVAAYSTTRALYATYDGPLYEIKRQSDGKTTNIGLIHRGGYAQAASQQSFCAQTICWLTRIYDQSPMHNDLKRAPRGNLYGPGIGGVDNLPIAGMAPVMLSGHQAYGVYIVPGMGLRDNATRGIAVDDQPEGMYWVVNGRHYNDGCCFDFGNAEIDSHDDGNGTMETAYFGNSHNTYYGPQSGPWLMTDQENNLVGCADPSRPKFCPNLQTVPWRFVTATAAGKPHFWRIMGGNSKKGRLSVMSSGPRVDSSYDPMRKQGGIVLGTGGDNSNRSQGTFYEGAMVVGFPTQSTQQNVQAAIVAARYRAFPLEIGPEAQIMAPPGLQTFSPGSSHSTTLRFTNTTGEPVRDVALSMSTPWKGWRTFVRDSGKSSHLFAEVLQPGASVSTTFQVVTGGMPVNGDLTAKASWVGVSTAQRHTVTRRERVRNVPDVRIHAFRIGTSAPINATNSFIDLRNESDTSVDISHWTLTVRPINQATFSRIEVPAHTDLAAHGRYVIALANSGLAASAYKGDKVIYVRNTSGMKVGDTIEIGVGRHSETRKISAVGTAASPSTAVWTSLPAGPLRLAAGAVNVPVKSVSGFAVGQKLAFGYPPNDIPGTLWKQEIATVTKVGTPGSLHRLSVRAPAGTSSIQVNSVKDISVGDSIRLGTDSAGHGVETITVRSINRAERQLTLAAPLRFSHAANLPFSDRGTGITFQPATRFMHSGNQPVRALGGGIKLQRPLSKSHKINAVVRDSGVTAAGYQGSAAANLWFGGPALHGAPTLLHSGRAGSLVLRNGGGLVVDSLNYGRVVDPWAAEGYQGESGRGQRGCMAPAPGLESGSGVSTVRIHNTDSNCADFVVRPTSSL